MSIDFHSRLEEQFAAFLQERGFPEDSIIYEPAFFAADKSRIYRPDFAIIDPKSKEQLAVIEVQGSANERHPANVAKLKAYSEALAGKSIEFFLATSQVNQEQAEHFTLHKIADDGTRLAIPLNSFPSFNSLTANKIATERDKIETQIAGTTDHFKVTCHAIAVFLFLVIVADFILKFKHINLLTTERLTAFGLVVALVIVPFAAKFKGFGIEYEKYIESKGG